MARSAKRETSAKQMAAMKPVLLAAGLGLYWFVAYQDGGGADAPMWGYLTVAGLRLLADFVGAWLVISALQLAIAIVKIGLTHLRALWLQEG
jgi:hypothetical protein